MCFKLSSYNMSKPIHPSPSVVKSAQKFLAFRALAHCSSNLPTMSTKHLQEAHGQAYATFAQSFADMDDRDRPAELSLRDFEKPRRA